MLLKFSSMDLRLPSTFLQTRACRSRRRLLQLVSYLYQLAGKHRYASALLATRIEKATHDVASRSEGRLAAVSRESLVRYPEIFADLDEEGDRP